MVHFMFGRRVLSSSNVLVGQSQAQEELARGNKAGRELLHGQRLLGASSCCAGRWAWVSYHPVVILHL